MGHPMAKNAMTKPATPSVRVLLIGNQPIMLAGLRLLLDREPDIEVIGDGTPARTGDGKTKPRHADVIVLDLDGGADLLTVIAPSVPRGTRLLILSSALDRGTLALAFRHGATGAVRKQQQPEVLAKAVRAVHNAEIWLEQTDMELLVTELSASSETASSPEARRAASLTHRERQVVALIGEGLRNTQVAIRLHISDVTVRNHLTSVFRKLRVTGRFELALYAFRYGLSKVPTKFRAFLPAAAGRKRPRRTKIS